MQITVQRNEMLSALQSLIGVVERKQTMPILSCVRIQASEAGLQITATNLELELIIHCQANVEVPGEVAVPAKKLLDICRGLPNDAELQLDIHGEHVRLRSGRARFLLALINDAAWPAIEDFAGDTQLNLNEAVIKQLLDKTEFAMAQQDVRYYLNGLFLVLTPDYIRCVATDGHRLALSEAKVSLDIEQPVQAIVPRKAIHELSKVLTGSDEQTIAVQISKNHLRCKINSLVFTTKLIDGRFPDYERVIPQDNDRRMVANREQVSQALNRAAILSNEKFGGVRLVLESGQLTIQAQNTDRESAEDHLQVNYDQEPLSIGFNVRYLLDALAAINSEEFILDLKNEDSSGLVTATNDDNTKYVVMPMRL